MIEDRVYIGQIRQWSESAKKESTLSQARWVLEKEIPELISRLEAKCDEIEAIHKRDEILDKALEVFNDLLMQWRNGTAPEEEETVEIVNLPYVAQLTEEPEEKPSRKPIPASDWAPTFPEEDHLEGVFLMSSLVLTGYMTGSEADEVFKRISSEGIPKDPSDLSKEIEKELKNIRGSNRWKWRS